MVKLSFFMQLPYHYQVLTLSKTNLLPLTDSFFVLYVLDNTHSQQRQQDSLSHDDNKIVSVIIVI